MSKRQNIDMSFEKSSSITYADDSIILFFFVKGDRCFYELVLDDNYCFLFALLLLTLNYQGYQMILPANNTSLLIELNGTRIALELVTLKWKLACTSDVSPCFSNDIIHNRSRILNQVTWSNSAWWTFLFQRKLIG